MYASHHIHRWLVPAVGAILVGGGIAAPASAAEDPGKPDWPSATELDGRTLNLLRIGDQFVRGDNLTGAGARAPSWIPEQGG